MPKIETNDIMTYHEIHGQGKSLVFIHGAGACHEMGKLQVEHFSKLYKSITHYVRGAVWRFG